MHDSSVSVRTIHGARLDGFADLFAGFHGALQKKKNEFQVLEISIFNGIKPLYMEYARDNFEYHFAIPRYYHKVFSAD